mmetsp:Transcript_3224/g.7875  ORF Transcript_3224/g.7875 Transcript_3224/m.7875 type:complete len:267 (-) Transcript_3224:428-1228(-)
MPAPVALARVIPATSVKTITQRLPPQSSTAPLMQPGLGLAKAPVLGFSAPHGSVAVEPGRRSTVAVHAVFLEDFTDRPSDLYSRRHHVAVLSVGASSGLRCGRGVLALHCAAPPLRAIRTRAVDARHVKKKRIARLHRNPHRVLGFRALLHRVVNVGSWARIGGRVVDDTGGLGPRGKDHGAVVLRHLVERHPPAENAACAELRVRQSEDALVLMESLLGGRGRLQQRHRLNEHQVLRPEHRPCGGHHFVRPDQLLERRAVSVQPE